MAKRGTQMMTSCGTTSGAAPLSVAHELADRTLYFYSYTDVGKEGAYSDDTTQYLKWCGSRA